MLINLSVLIVRLELIGNLGSMNTGNKLLVFRLLLISENTSFFVIHLALALTLIAKLRTRLESKNERNLAGMINMNNLIIVGMLLLIAGIHAQAGASDSDLGMFAGSKTSELPDYYREINTPVKLKTYQLKLEAIPKNAVVTKIDGQAYHCIDRGGHDLASGLKVSDFRCWKK
jgi:hypothetical protein